MKNEYRYILEKNSRKHLCPGCGKKSFVWYIDIETGQPLPDQYGRCDREINCSYHKNPYKEGYSAEKLNYFFRMPQQIRQNPACIPIEVLNQTLTGYERNTFLQNLLYHVPFPVKEGDLEMAIALYFLGSVNSGYRAGAITFPFIDIAGKVRAIQVKQFNLENHTTRTDFLHSIIEKQCQQNNEPLPDWLIEYQKNERKVSCLFGEHLLKKYQSNPIALVEAPKTAIYGTLYFGIPDNSTSLLWLAVYNLSSLTYEKCRALKGRHVYLFPDLSKDNRAFNIWSKKARELSEKMPGTLFKVSDLLEQKASEKERLNGSDLADFLIKQDWRRFRFQPINIGQSEKGEKGESSRKPFVSTEEKFLGFPTLGKEKKWNLEISELERFYKLIPLPKEPIRLDQCSLITDPALFIKSHLDIVKCQNGNMRFKPYLDRLTRVKLLISRN
jgi:hypothetical protein